MANSRLLVVLPLFLVSCSPQAPQGDPSICGSSLTERPDAIPPAPADYQQSALACVEQWSARLARSKQDSAATVADAVIATCAGELSRLEGKGIYIPAAVPSELPKEAQEYWRGKALFIAVQTRAGNCYQGD